MRNYVCFIGCIIVDTASEAHNLSNVCLLAHPAVFPFPCPVTPDPWLHTPTAVSCRGRSTLTKPVAHLHSHSVDVNSISGVFLKYQELCRTYAPSGL